MEYLHHGGERVVFQEWDTVLKFPIDQAGKIENANEAARYKMDPDPRLASCELRDDGVLVMELLHDDKSFEYAQWEAGVACELYEIIAFRVQPKDITCNKKCIGCPHNKVQDFSKYADFKDIIAKESWVQCAYDKDGNLKIYDYGTLDPEERKEFGGPFEFYDGCEDIFIKYIKDGNKPETFSEWAYNNPDSLPPRKPISDYRWINKSTRERVCKESLL